MTHLRITFKLCSPQLKQAVEVLLLGQLPHDQTISHYFVTRTNCSHLLKIKHKSTKIYEKEKTGFLAFRDIINCRKRAKLDEDTEVLFFIQDQ